MNATNFIYMPLKLSLSITPIRIGKMHQFFLSGNNFVAEKHTEQTICPITMGYPLLNLDARLSISGSFKQIFFEADLV